MCNTCDTSNEAAMDAPGVLAPAQEIRILKDDDNERSTIFLYQDGEPTEIGYIPFSTSEGTVLNLDAALSISAVSNLAVLMIKVGAEIQEALTEYVVERKKQREIHSFGLPISVVDLIFPRGL